jgi:hypothetical protein
MDSWAFSVNWFGLHLYWRRGNNLENILLLSPVADLSDPVTFLGCRNAVYSSLSGCRSAGLYLLRMQK